MPTICPQLDLFSESGLRNPLAASPATGRDGAGARYDPSRRIGSQVWPRVVVIARVTKLLAAPAC